MISILRPGREGADPDATARFLRACASMGLVEYGEKGFTGTELLALLHPDAPLSLHGMAVSQAIPGLWQTWAP